MLANTKEEIDTILKYCMAKRVSETRTGSGFYKLLEKNFIRVNL